MYLYVDRRVLIFAPRAATVRTRPILVKASVCYVSTLCMEYHHILYKNTCPGQNNSYYPYPELNPSVPEDTHIARVRYAEYLAVGGKHLF